MNVTEIKAIIEKKEINRKELAKKIGCGYGYLSQMLNEFFPLKQKWHDRIVAELEKHK
jgi:hypothetical protein